MTFDEMLAQIVDLLKRQGRVSYGALKRRFDLDDDYLNDLKDEILFTSPQIVDEGGRGLVWVGETGTPPASISTQPAQSPRMLHTQPAHGASPTTAPHTPEAERRQLTVMFCDLVDSTKLSSQLDPEDWRDVVRAYQTACTEVIRRYDGHIAQFLGDGLLVYFGYPQAHEDDAQRAVRTGLGLLAAMGDLNTRLQREQGIQLSVRIGIHTGLVVVGEMGSQGRQEQLALGQVPNVCSRIQGLAAPNTIAMSEATYRLVEGYFTCESLGEPTLRGVSQPLKLYRVLEASGAISRLEVAQPRGLTPLVGRESEVTLLLERWEQVKAGQGQVVLLTGDAGIGKSRLVQMLKEHVADEPHMRWECRSSEYSQNTALYPLIELFQWILRFETQETPDAKLEKLEHALSQYRFSLEESVQLFAPLLALPVPENRYPLLNLSPQRQRQKTLETIVAILLEHAEHQPVLFILEDLHWADPSTLELLGLLLDQVPTAHLLLVLTCRLEFRPPWALHSHVTPLTLTRLLRPQVEELVLRVTGGKPLPAEVLRQIVEKTDGIPLFVEELVKTILESGLVREEAEGYVLTGPLPPLAIPTTLQDTLMARLDRLAPVKAVAQLGAVLGREFAYTLLQAVAPWDEATLQHGLTQLVKAELLYQRGMPPQATYLFKHALIQDAAYQSLLRSTRRQYHQRIAQVLETQFPDICETQPELLAQHYTEAGVIAQAIPHWQRAGERARQRSANAEAVAHLTKGLGLLTTLPETLERARQELDLQTTLGPALMAIKGYAAPDVERVYTRARALCQQMRDTSRLFPVLWGLWMYHFVRGELQGAYDLGEQCLSLAQRLPNPAFRLEAHRALGTTLFFQGELSAARAHLEQSITCYDPQRHRSLALLYGQDPKVTCLSYMAWALWLLGYPAQALQRSREALSLAQELAHPFTLALALVWAGILYWFRREGQATQEQAEAVMTLAREQGFVQRLAGGTMLRGWALAVQGARMEGVAEIQHGLTIYQAARAGLGQTHWLALLAEAYGKAGQTEEALSALADALAAVDNTGERHYEAELHRLKGKLLLGQEGKRQRATSNSEEEPETSFQQALDVARRQQAKSLELRATMSLARLWQHQGKHAEAWQLLGDVYGWFTEGFDTADLQEAKALLEALA